MTTSLMIRPEDDEISRTVGQWLAELEAKLTNDHPQYHVAVLSGERASRSAINSILANDSVDLIAYYGHGGKDSLGVRDSTSPSGSIQGLIDAGNSSLCSGKALYVVACLSGCFLAPHILAQGVSSTAYFGYDEELWLPPADDVCEMIKKVVNSALSKLHNRDLSLSNEFRYLMCEKSVQDGYLRLAGRLKGEGRNLESAFVGLWRGSFISGWVT